jgi:hypothetical protein
MKNVIYIVVMLMGLISYGKKVDSTVTLDKLSFEYINQYREYNGSPRIKWSDKLYKISVSHTNKLIKVNKSKYPNGGGIFLYHSGTNTYENCMSMGWNRKNAGFKNSPFYDFTKTYFNIDKEDLTINDYLTILPIWSWHNSPPHKKNLLNKGHTFGSTHVGEDKVDGVFKSGKYTYNFTYYKIYSTSNFK